MNLSKSDVEALQNHVDGIQKIIDANTKITEADLTYVKPFEHKNVKWFQDRVDQGAIFYAGHGYELHNAHVSATEYLDTVRLNERFDCYSNGCVFAYSFPPHDIKIDFKYDVGIPNKPGYKY